MGAYTAAAPEVAAKAWAETSAGARARLVGGIERAWIRALVWISGRDIQRETIQVMLDAGYADGYRRLHPDIKGYTFPTWDPHLRLDYVFVPTAFADRLKTCEVITEAPALTQASDHLPLLAHLDLNGDGSTDCAC